MAEQRTDAAYHIVAAVGAPSQLNPLLRVGCALAAAHRGRLTILSVTPDGQRPAWLHLEALEELRSTRICNGASLRIVVRAGRKPGDGILAAAQADPPDLLLLGWSGGRGRGRYLLGSTLDPVVQYAPCDVAVVRAEGKKGTLSDPLATIEQVLIPTHGGPNAALAIDLALALSPQAQVAALYVARAAQGEVALSLARQQLDEILDPWAGEPRVQGKIVQSSSPVPGILGEAARGYDLVMVGASHESYLDRVLFGNIPQTIAARSPVPSIVVKRRAHRLRVGTWLRRAGWQLFDMLPTLDLHEQTEVYKAIREGAQPQIDFFVMIALAAALATFGLLQNSPAVIIGAMLVAPLMAAIFGMSLGMVRGDLRLMQRAASATLRGMVLAIAVAALLSLILRTGAARGIVLPNEILNRTHPNLLDLVVALASGAAGAYAQCRKNVSTSLPGVAIAAALVPPLAVMGIGLALWDGEVAGGASLLFVTNLVAIVAAGGVVFLWLGFRPIPGRQERARVFRGGMYGTVGMLLAVTALLGVLSVHSVRKAILNREIGRALEAEIGAMEQVELEQWKMLPTEDDGDTLRLQVWVRSPRTVRYQEAVDLQEAVAGHMQRPVELQLSIIPTTHLDPREPPTPTPTLPPGATASFTPSPTPTPTPTPTHTPTPTPTFTPTPTATATPTPTPTFTPTPTPTFTPTSTPTPALAEVGGTGGQGVWMYRQPSLKSAKVQAWRDGAVMILSGEQAEADGYLWLQVIDPRGRLGWIPERYLIRLGRPPGQGRDLFDLSDPVWYNLFS